LGSIFTLGLLLLLLNGLDSHWWATYQFGFFLAAWSAFHWGEYAVTAGWNRPKLSVDSYLLDNGRAYHVAHLFGLTEYFIELYFWPSSKDRPYISQIGMVISLIGQIVRSAAMIQASQSFSHSLASRKLESHKLVTHGVYAWSRHPSYLGFIYWAIGIQVALQNPVSVVVFFFVLLNFFSIRIRHEEKALVKFFGQDYVEYKKRVGTKIPFIR